VSAIPTIKPTAAPSAGLPRVADRAIDAAERLLVLALYAWLVWRLVQGYRVDGKVANLLLLPSEGLVVVFMLLRRRASEISRRPVEWLLAVGATCAPMLVTSGGRALAPATVCATVLMMGLLVQLHAKLTLGRSIGCIPAHRGLKLAGPYRFVRHPMYAGYMLSHLGFLAMNPTPLNLTLYVLDYALQIPRLMAEERLLGGDPLYREYQASVRYRLIPGLF